MNRATTHALRALASLAEVDACDAALALADCLDRLAEADQEASTAREQVTQIAAVSTRLAQPGGPVNPAAMSMLARQSVVAHMELEQAQGHVRSASELADQQRLLAHQQQRRRDGLRDLVKDALRQQAVLRDRKLAQETEDLFLGRRFRLEGHQ